MPISSSSIDRVYKRCLQSRTRDIITAKTVRDYCISPFMVHCAKFAPEEKKDPMTQYQAIVMDQGKRHETYVMKIKYPKAQVFEYETPKKGFKILLEEMKKGTEVICGLPGFYLPEGLMGSFDVLERRSTESSIFGSYHYVVKEIKLAKSIQKHHISQAAFCNYILGKIQRYTSPSIFVINRDCKEFEKPYDEAGLLVMLQDIREIFGGKTVSPSYGVCDWPWKSYNNDEATKLRDVSLVGGVGPSLKNKLTKAGVHTLDDLAKVSNEDLAKIKGVGSKKAHRLFLKTKALTSGKHIRVGTCNFPKKQTELFLDLEGTGEQMGQDEELIAIDYLIGVLARTERNLTYKAFVAHGTDKECEMFLEFVNWLKKSRDFVIYHYHNYERVHLRRLAQRCSLPKDRQRLIFRNMRNLYDDAVSSFVFPTRGNGLKEIAGYMGYEWKHKDVDALESIALYFQYVMNPKRNSDQLRKVVEYNEDDCRATSLVKEWLEENLKKASAEGFHVSIRI